jgi:protoheme IX farnesyltransferase
VALVTGFTSIGGPLYMAVAVVLNALFIAGAWRIWRRPEEAASADKYAVEKRFFALSLAYLFGHFAALLLEATPWADALAGALNWPAFTWETLAWR